MQRSVNLLERLLGGRVDGDVQLGAGLHPLHLLRKLGIGHQERGDPTLVKNSDKPSPRKMIFFRKNCLSWLNN